MVGSAHSATKRHTHKLRSLTDECSYFNDSVLLIRGFGVLCAVQNFGGIF